MFYQEEHSSVLRLGDVVEGYISTRPTITKPIASPTQAEQFGNVDIELPSYSVVLSPCCSIDDGIISLTPLIQIVNKVFLPPHFKEDATRINKIVEPKLSVPPYIWTSRSFREKRDQLLADGPAYTFNDYFVYEANDIFTEYTVNMKEQDNISTSHYMIDFRNIYSLKCSLIKRGRDEQGDDSLIRSKRLELSVKSRLILRQKLSYYFFRPAPEDEAVILADS